MPKIKPHPIIVRSDNTKPPASGVSAMALDEIVEVSVPFLGDMPDAETLPEITHQKVKCFAVYCDSIRWDGQESTMDKTGDGSAHRPYRNARYALQQILCTLEKTCFLPMFILYLTGEVNYAVSHKALSEVKFTDTTGPTRYVWIHQRNFYRKRIIISGEKAPSGKLLIRPERLRYDPANSRDEYPGESMRDTFMYSFCVPQALLTQHIVFDHSNITNTRFYTSGTFFNCDFLYAGQSITGGFETPCYYRCKFVESSVGGGKFHSCEIHGYSLCDQEGISYYLAASTYCVAVKATNARLSGEVIRDCDVRIKKIWNDTYTDRGFVFFTICEADTLVNSDIMCDVSVANSYGAHITGTDAAETRNSSAVISCDCGMIKNDVGIYGGVTCILETGLDGSPMPTITNFPSWQQYHPNFSKVVKGCITGASPCSLIGTMEEWRKEFEWVRYTKIEYNQKIKNTKTYGIEYHYEDNEAVFDDPVLIKETTETISGCE